MRWCAAAVLGIAISAVILAEPKAHAQQNTAGNQPAGPSDQPPPTGSRPAVEASPIDTFLLRDSKGNLVPVLDLPFEEFERLLRLKRGLAAPAPPGFTLDKLTGTGTANSNLADLELVLSIRVREGGVVRVPLGLGSAILRQPAKHTGPGEHFVTHDASDGYVLWLSGEGEPHVVTLHISTAIASSAGQPRLALALPRATESSLQLKVPVSHAQAQIAAGEGIASAKDLGGGQSELSVLGPAGSLELAWQAGRDPAASRPAAMEASGEILVKVEGENRISSDARLRVRSTSGVITSFRVRLPRGMELVPTEAVGCSATVIEPMPSAGRGPPAQTVEIVFDRPQAGVVEVRLLAEQSASFTPGPLQPGRFEVLGAVRQRGTIGFSMDGDWQLSWKEDASVRRLDLPADASAAKLVARYEYSRQPCGLELRVASRPSRIGVEGVHVVYVDDRQLRLETTLKYRLRGSRAAGLQFELGKWQLVRVNPSELFEVAPADAPAQPGGSPAHGSPGTASGPRLVAFRSGAVIPPELEVKLEAQRPIDPASTEVEFELPRAIGDAVAPATVMIAPADNVELTPQNVRITGLALDRAPPAVRFPSRQQAPLVYRELAADDPASFAADFRVRTRWSTASARAKVQLDPQEMQVEQRLEYRIDYESRRTFDLLIPRAVLLGRPLELLHGDVALTPTPVADAPQVGDTTRYQVITDADQIGFCQLVVKYSLPLPKWDRQKPLPLALPLVVPADESHQQPGGQQIEFITTEPLAIKPDQSVGSEFTRPAPTSAGAQPAYALSQVSPISRWIIEPTAGSYSPSVVVEKMWIQTWLARDVRQERAAFQLITDAETVHVRLPSAPRPASVHSVVNGQTIETVLQPNGIVAVPIPPSARGRQSAVELWYALDNDTSASAISVSGWTSSQWKPPALVAAAAPRRFYWQFGLPGDQFLVVPPTDLASEMEWEGGWGPIWSRPVRSQEDLESWIGATRQDSLPRGANQYLFSAIGSAPPLAVLFASRRIILAIGGGAALILGLALLHVGALRRPESVLVLAVILAALALAFPNVAVLAAQAAGVGLAIALAIALWSWFTSGRLVWTPATVQLAPPEPRSTEAREPAAERMTGLTTATAAAGSGVAEPTP